MRMRAYMRACERVCADLNNYNMLLLLSGDYKGARAETQGEK